MIFFIQVSISNRINSHPKCTRCLNNRVRKIKRNNRLKRKIENDVKMNFDDFIDLAKAYFFNLEWIDPFTGIYNINFMNSFYFHFI